MASQEVENKVELHNEAKTSEVQRKVVVLKKHIPLGSKMMIRVIKIY